MVEPLYRLRSERPMHVAVFGSGSGTILRAMLAAQKKNSAFSIRLLYTDRECRFQEIAKEENLPLIYHPWKGPREVYDQRGLEFVRAHPCPIDLLLLAGYMRLMSSAWLNAFPYRILNIHPADLTALDRQGQRRYIGVDAVRLALQSGETQTRSSAILIDETVDGGPVLVSGPWLSYTGPRPVTEELAAQHQSEQKAKSDWPACLRALELIGEGRISFKQETQELFLDGEKLPPGGEEVPSGETYVWDHRDFRL